MVRDAVYVLVALALCACIVVAADLIRRQTPPTPPRISMLELKEFAELPGEFRSALKKMMPDPVMIRRQWKQMTADQRRGLIQQMTGGMLPQPKGCQGGGHAEPPAPPTPPAPVEEEKKAPPPLKKGFLLKQDKKKHPKNKENNEVITLSTIKPTIEEWTEETDGLASNDGDAPFLGSDD